MIEDDTDIAEMLSDYLSQFHIEVDNYEEPFTGISALNVKKYDLLILDLSLPGLDGLEVCREIRMKSEIPIIISSARSDLEDKVSGLQLGADDYLPKPYEPRELYARIQSVLRRYKVITHPEKESKPGAFKIDEEGQQIFFNNSALQLTLAEYEILSHLIRKKNCVVSRAGLVAESTALNDESYSRSLDTLIGRIRHKIEENSRKPRYIISIRGIGYKLVDS